MSLPKVFLFKIVVPTKSILMNELFSVCVLQKPKQQRIDLNLPTKIWCFYQDLNKYVLILNQAC